MPARPKKKLKRKTESTLTETDLEFLLIGCNLFCGESHSYKTIREQKAAYKRNRAYLLSLIGTDACPYGTRPWAWWRFEHAEDHGRLYFKFSDNRQKSFEFLKGEDLLLPKEQENFVRQEKRHADRIAQLRSSGAKPERTVVDFPETNIDR